MRTKANIKSHALHQMLIPFPIGFLAGAFIFDLLGLLLEDVNLNRTAFYLGVAGVITGLTAAVPGFIDFIYSVPPESSAKKRGIKHLSVNITAIALFTSAVIIRDKIMWNPGPEIIFIQTAGVILLSMGGWMGGTLVNRNFIGPEHRYANKGKWSEISFKEKRDEYEVANEDELGIDQLKLVRIKDKRIALCRTKEGWSAIDDRCTHRGGSLADGVAVCGIVHCLWHGSQFDVKTGEVKSGPAEKEVSTYTVAVRSKKVYIIL